MKKRFFYMAAAAMTLVSCSNEEVVKVSSDHPIDFRVTMGTQTNSRGTETTTTNLGQFYVTAVNNGEIYFQNELFTKGEDNTYTHTPVYYWPGDGSTLNFYAYSYNSGTSTDEEGNSKLNSLDANKYGTVNISANSQTIAFSPQTKIEDQIDLVATTATGSKSNASSGVELTFKHILSQIKIMAKNGNTNYKYEVVGIEIGNVCSSGTYNFKSESESSSSWSNTTGSQTYSVDLTNSYSETNTSGFKVPVTLDGTAKDIMDITALGGTGAMLIPQDLTPWEVPETPTKGTASATANNAGAYIAVKLKITMNGTNTVIYPKNSNTSSEESEEYAYAYVPFPANTNWVEGNCYTYTLDFTEGAGYEYDGTPILGGAIKFSNVTVTAWTDANSIDVNVE